MPNSNLTQRFFGSHRRSVVSIFLLSIITASLLSHSFDQMKPRPIQDLYLKIDRLDLNSQQRVALRAVRNLFVEEKCLGELDTSESEFLLAVAGILTDDQFREFSGNAKNDRQKLRYELRQIRAEMVLHGEGDSLTRR